MTRLSAWWAAGRIFRYRTGLFVISSLHVLGWNCSLLLVGWALQRVFNALDDDSAAGVGIYEVIAVLAAVEAGRLAVVWSGVADAKCWQYMRGLLRLNLLRAQLHSGGAPTASPGEAVSRFRDDVDDFLAFLESAQDAAGKVVLVVGSLTIMLSIQPVIALAAVLPLLSVMVATRVARGRIRTHRVAFRRASAAVTGLLGELFGAVLAVKSAHAGSSILGQLTRVNERRRRAGLRDTLITRLLSRFNTATVDVSIGIMLLLAVPAMRQGDFTVGDLALFVAYISGLRWAPYYFGQMLARHRQAEVAIDRMTALLPPERPQTLVTHRPLRGGDPLPVLRDRPALERLTVSGLTAVHAASGRGVHDVSLTLERGTFTVVTGPAGAGKTTLLRAVLGLVQTQAGCVWWNDILVDDRAAFFVPPRSAYVPQVPRLFSESLRDNLLLGLEDTSGLWSAVHAAVLDRDVASLPSGLDTQVGARGVRLSGGQVQRTAIARALVRGADLLVLDDVSSALDVDTERLLWDRLLADADRALLVVSNRPATIARADQVIRVQADSLLAEAA